MKVQAAIVDDPQFLWSEDFTTNGIVHDESIVLAFFGLTIVLVHLDAAADASKEASKAANPPGLEVWKW